MTSTAPPTLFTPLTVGDLTLKNRVLMSPMTRDRATPDLVPTDLDAETSMVLYYAQRSSAGERIYYMHKHATGSIPSVLQLFVHCRQYRKCSSLCRVHPP